MPTPIDPVSHRDLSWPDLPSDRPDFREDVARRTDERAPATVLGAVIWGDATDVSNACRRAKDDTIDGFLCNDAPMHTAQSWCAQIAQKAIELVLCAKMKAK